MWELIAIRSKIKSKIVMNFNIWKQWMILIAIDVHKNKTHSLWGNGLLVMA